MKVICTNVPMSPTGEMLETSPWVTVGAEYRVVSVVAEPARRVLVQIVTDDGSLGLFDSTNFMTVDGAVPERWTARIGEGGVLELAPTAWLAPGFWEAYYDGDSDAVDAVESELRRRWSTPGRAAGQPVRGARADRSAPHRCDE